MKCKVCGVDVFHLTCTCGTNVLFEDLRSFELHPAHRIDFKDSEGSCSSTICARLSFATSHQIKEVLRPAIRRWRQAGVLDGEPERLSSLKYEIRFTNGKIPSVLNPLANLILAGVIIQSCDGEDPPHDLATNKSEVLFLIASDLVRSRPCFFDIKGPGAGDIDTALFMKELRDQAAKVFNIDHSEKKICGDNNLCVDFYFPDEATVVEVALGLRNPLSEYERDILKAIMAKESGNVVTDLVFISKPGANKRLSQPSARCIAAWAERNHGIKIHIRELTGN